MPPPLFNNSGGLIKAASYLANFTVGIVVAGFDIKQSGYSEDSSANATIRPIPWANPPNASLYAVVIQVGGLQPRRRPYKVIVYSETDYDTLRGFVGQLGTLTTPRETAAPAMLNSVKRADFQDPGSPTGLQTVDLEFIMTT